jgi:hypothetical protein
MKYTKFFAVFLLTLLFILPVGLKAQNDNQDNAQDNSKLDYKPWSFNLNFGQTLFWGDVNDEITNPFSANFNPDISSFAYGLIIQKNFNSWLGIDFQYLGGNLHGTRTLWSNNDTAGLYFNSKINQFGLNLDIDVFDLFMDKQPIRLFNFYIRGGGAYNLYDATEYRTADNSVTNTAKAGAVEVMGGWGVRFDISKAVGFTFENTFTYAFDDFLDAHSTEYSKANDLFAYTSLGVTYRIYPKPKKPRLETEEEIIPEDTTVASGGGGEESQAPAPELSVKVVMPSVIKAGDTVLVSLKVYKYDLNEKAKLQQTLPSGFSAVAKDNSTAEFNFSDQIISYNWIHFPGVKEYINLSYYLVAGDVEAGNYSIPGIIFYDIDGNEKIKQFKQVITVKKPKPAVVAKVEPSNQPVDIVKTQPVTNPSQQSSTKPARVTGDLEYRVQVKAIYGGKSSTQAIARQYGIDKPVQEEFVKGYTKYTAGSFATYEDAKAYRDRLRSQKVPGAFVVAYYKSNRMKNIKEAIRMEKTSAPAVSPTKITQQGVSYSVQIAASTRKLSATSLASQFGVTDNVIMTTHNGLYKYMVGSFTSYEDAKAKLYEIRNLVPDAFIVKYVNGVRQ